MMHIIEDLYVQATEGTPQYALIQIAAQLAKEARGVFSGESRIRNVSYVLSDGSWSFDIDADPELNPKDSTFVVYFMPDRPQKGEAVLSITLYRGRFCGELQFFLQEDSVLIKYWSFISAHSKRFLVTKEGVVCVK